MTTVLQEPERFCLPYHMHPEVRERRRVYWLTYIRPAYTLCPVHNIAISCREGNTYFCPACLGCPRDKNLRIQHDHSIVNKA